MIVEPLRQIAIAGGFEGLVIASKIRVFTVSYNCLMKPDFRSNQ